MTIIYHQFDVVVVPFPFTDREATKRRPALVLSDSTNFNNIINCSVMAMITTASHSSWPLDIPIENLVSAGLKSPSLIRMKLFTLDHQLMIKTIGRLAENDQLQVQAVLQTLFNITR